MFVDCRKHLVPLGDIFDVLRVNLHPPPSRLQKQIFQIAKLIYVMYWLHMK